MNTACRTCLCSGNTCEGPSRSVHGSYHALYVMALHLGLAFGLIVSVILAGCSGGGDSGGGGAVYINVYIDPDAPASGDGSLAAPYKFWSEATFQAGYAYLQKRGTVADEEVTVDQSGTAGLPLLLGAYGTGADPVIRGSAVEMAWSDAGIGGKEVFQKTLTLGIGERLGNVCEDAVPLDFLAWDTDPATTFASASAGSYAYDYAAGTVYVWCTDAADPATHVMEVSRRSFGIHGEEVSYVTIQDLHIQNVSVHGILFKSSMHITVKNCTLETIGGAAALPGPPIIYAGNGIEFGNACSDCLVDGCLIQDVFDSGISPQTYDNNMDASDFQFVNSSVLRCGLAGIEIAVLTAGTNCSISNVTVADNIITDSGLGWSGIRFGTAGRGIQVSADAASGTVRGVRVERTEVTGCGGAGIYLTGDAGLVTIHRADIHGNNQDGIEVSDAVNPATLQLALSSSIIRENGSNDGANDRFGVSFNLPYGAGLQIQHTTFYDNASISLAIWANGGTVVLRNNLFHTSGGIGHFLSNVALPGADIDYNCYTEHGGAIIHVVGSPNTPYTTVASFAANTAFAAHSIGTADPLVNTDFTLITGSPCIGTGVAGTGIDDDFSGTAFANPPAIGAHEF